MTGERVPTVQCYRCATTAMPRLVGGVPVGWGATGNARKGERRYACPAHLPDLRRELGLSERRPSDG